MKLSKKNCRFSARAAYCPSNYQANSALASRLGKTPARTIQTSMRTRSRLKLTKFLSSLEGETLRLIELLYGHVVEQVRNEQDMWLKKSRNMLLKQQTRVMRQAQK